MPRFIDIHSHVLYGMDDGAETVEESVAMLELARDAGTTDIVATPHANGRYPFQPDRIAQQIAELTARVPGITIHSGCDFHLQVDNIQDALVYPRKYTVNQRDYLLVEFPDMSVFPGSDDILGRLLGAGMMPIVTHPERNAYLQRNPDVLARWVEGGCYVQVTAASCMGLFGRRAKAGADEMLNRNLVHFIASDAHDVDHRPPDLRQAYAELVKEWGEARVRPLFVDNPRAVLRGDEIETTVVRTVGTAKRWYQFWR